MPDTLVIDKATAVVAKSDATLFSFFMVLLSRKASSVISKIVRIGIGNHWPPPSLRVLTTDRQIVP